MNKFVLALALAAAAGTVLVLVLTDQAPGTSGVTSAPRGPSTELAGPAPEISSELQRAESSLTVPAEPKGNEPSLSNTRRTTSQSGVEVHGRVTFPELLPADEQALLEVRVPRAKTEEEEELEIEDTLYERSELVPLGPSGTFTFIPPPGIESLELDLEARYLYLEEPIRIDVSELGRDEQLLHPKVGVWITGTVQLPHSAVAEGLGLDDKAALVSPNTMNSGDPFGGNWQIRPRFKEFETGSTEFEFLAVPARGLAQVRVLPSAFPAASKPAFELLAGTHIDLRFALEEGCSVSGQVTDLAGIPQADVEIEVQREAVVFGRGGWDAREGTTDAEGYFLLEAIPSGECSISFKKSGFLDSMENLVLVKGERRSDLEVQMDSGRSITGTVLWPDGQPAAGTEVQIRFDPAFLAGIEAFNSINGSEGEAETDEQGNFQITGLGAGPFVAGVEAKPSGAGDSSPAWIARESAVRPGEHLTLQLTEPLGIYGKLVDDLGQPIQEFTIDARKPGEGVVPGYGAESVVDNFTDEGGEFFLDGLREGEWQLIPQAPGHGLADPLEISLPLASGEPVLLQLDRGAVVHGIVVGTDGDSVVDARVSLNVALSDLTLLTDRIEEFSATTNEEGRFLLENVPTGPQELIASADGFGPSEPYAVELGPGEEQSAVVLTLRSGGTIAGVLYGADGEPSSGKMIIAQSPKNLSRPNVTATDSKGEFRFEHLEEGSYQVISMSSGAPEPGKEGGTDITAMIGGMQLELCEVTEGGEAFVVLGAPPVDPVSVFGRVTASGEPADGVMITWLPDGETADRSSMAFTTSGEDGNYHIDLESHGDYFVTVQKVTGTMEQQSIEFFRKIPEDTEQNLDFDLPTGSISGRVLGPDGEPAARARVTLSVDGAISNGSIAGGSFAEVVTAEDGTYEVQWLNAGEYSLAAGGAPLASLLGDTGTTGVGRSLRYGVLVREGQATTGIDFQLEESGTIEGSVVDESGSPVRGAAIFVRDEEGRPLERVSFVTTDAGGKFEVAGLAPGSYLISARSPSLVNPVRIGADVQSGKTSKVELQLGEGTLLLITLTDRQGNSVRCNLEVTDSQGHQVNGLWTYAELMTKISGGSGLSSTELEIGPLPPGRYTLRATTEDGRDAKKTVSLSGQTERRVKLRLD